MKHFFNMTEPCLTQVQQQEMHTWTFQRSLPLYSPDLAPSDFHLFPKLKEHMKGQRFSCDEEVKSAVRKWFQKQNTNFFKGWISKTSATLVEVY